jgi:integrase-like protein
MERGVRGHADAVAYRPEYTASPLPSVTRTAKLKRQNKRGAQEWSSYMPLCGKKAPCAGLAVREVGSADAPKPRLFDRVRAALRTRHYSRRTEDAYVAWIKRYIVFHGKHHPAEMGAPEVGRFLTSLAVDSHVAASTQNQALSALLFLYRDVLEVDLPWLDGVVSRAAARCPHPRRGPPRLMACLLYSAGLRVLGGI